MKGVILAGGTGSRLGRLTKVTNKHLLPVYDKPMICYPLETLINSGIKEILIVSGREHLGHICEFLVSGKEWNVSFSYEVQDTAGGIAQALSLAERFCNKDNLTVILGDNIFENTFKEEISSFKEGARIFLKEVKNPERFGVAELDDSKKVKKIIEKPKYPKTNYAVTGLYTYDFKVFDIIKKLKPSGRGELEITDVNNSYISNGKMDVRFVEGFWSDAGTFESLYNAATFIRNRKLNP